MSAPITGRRAMVGAGASILLLAAAAAGAAKAAELDGDLLAACAEFHRVDEECRCYDNIDLEDGFHDHQNEYCEDILWPRHAELVRVITGLPARTPEGVLAKARVARTVMVFDVHLVRDNGTDEISGDRHERLAWSLLNDVLGRA